MAAPAGTQTSPRDDEIADRIGDFLSQADPEEYGDEERKEPAPASGESDETKVGESTDEESEKKADTEEPKEKTEAEEKPKEEAEEEEGIESVADLAQVFGTEESEILDTLTVVPSEGAEPVTLQTLVERYNEGADTTQIEAARTEFETKRSELEEDFGKRADELQALTAAMIGLIEVDQAEMEKVKDVDPHRWAELRQQADEKHAVVQKALRNFEETRAALGKRDEDELNAYYQREREAIMRAMPAWKDEKVCRAAFTQMEKTLTAVGFTREEIENMSDHRAMQVAWKASEYDRMTAKSAEVKEKKFLKLPKGSIRKSARDDSAPQREAAAKRKARMARTREGDEDAAAALFAEHLDD